MLIVFGLILVLALGFLFFLAWVTYLALILMAAASVLVFVMGFGIGSAISGADAIGLATGAVFTLAFWTIVARHAGE